VQKSRLFNALGHPVVLIAIIHIDEKEPEPGG
jgi:hypothetical protein